MRPAALLQTSGIAIVCALFAAKLPSLVDADARTFSWVSAIVGACMAFFAGFIGSRFASGNSSFEASVSLTELRLLRGALVGFMSAVASFTAYLYFPVPWVKAIVGISVIAGAACVLLCLIAKWTQSGARDV